MCLLCLFVAGSDFVPFCGLAEICHFGSDGFCLFASKTRVLTSCNHLDCRAEKYFFAVFDKLHPRCGK
jgi:hypothetical protein